MTQVSKPWPDDQAGTPPLAAAYLVTGICWLVVGVALGINMAVTHDFTLKPVHAHANLLGWATNALFGCFYWLRGGKARWWEWLGYGAYSSGGLMMLTGLTAVLLDISLPPIILPLCTVLIAVAVLQMVMAIIGNVRGVSRRPSAAHV